MRSPRWEQGRVSREGRIAAALGNEGRIAAALGTDRLQAG